MTATHRTVEALHSSEPHRVAITRDGVEAKELPQAGALAVGEEEQSERFKSLGQLAGGVAHDFNNLLMVILNHAAFAADAAPSDDPAQVHIAEILSASQRGVRLTRQLLLFARRDPVQIELLVVRTVVEDIRSILTTSVGSKIKLIARPRDDHTAVCADRGQLEQILLNLALNARDAMPEGGTLCIEWAVTDLDAAAATRAAAGLCAGRYVEFKVTDNGCGMTEEVAARAFEPFFTTKPRSAGSGLGLATVKTIVTAAGGALSLGSVVGLGTSVRILLPAVNAPVVHGSSQPAETRSLGSRETVLVVEAEELVREGTVLTLERHGYIAVGVASVYAALTLAEDVKFDLLLTDVVVPTTSGSELVAELRDRGLACPVLHLSGYAESKAAEAPILSAVANVIRRNNGETLG